MASWVFQELAIEARSIMWAMVGNNVAVLGAFLHCNLEDVNGPARTDAEHPKIFSGILVGALALYQHFPTAHVAVLEPSLLCSLRTT